MKLIRRGRFILLFCAIAAGCSAEGWWMREPIRWVQTNLRETDAAMDTRRLVDQLAAMRANVVLMGMGGIAAYYPTRTEFHYPSPYLPAGRDMFGDVLKEAHARGIRVVGRYDLSKTPKAAYDAHPEWFFRKADGSPVVYNGLYSTCINGGYYRGQAMKILAEQEASSKAEALSLAQEKFSGLPFIATTISGLPRALACSSIRACSPPMSGVKYWN